MAALPPAPAGLPLLAIYRALLAHYGPQHWWPCRSGSPWEIMVGAVLVQRTTWRNVERALDALEDRWGLHALSDPRVMLDGDTGELEDVLRPSGFPKAKVAKVRNLARFILDEGGPELFAASHEPDEALRARLLQVWGVGPETADSILLYALGRPVFVGDAYSTRLAARWGLLAATSGYHATREFFMDNLPQDRSLLGECHAIVVAHAKEVCRRRPLCGICPLNEPRPLSGQDRREGDWRCPKVGIEQ